MYLRTIELENTGPITSLNLQLPFREDLPLPVVFVGPNGSGKSTILSYIVNALVGFKQQAFTKSEIENGHVYRLRSPRFIRNGSNWCYARMSFDDELFCEEWVLDRARELFESQITPLPVGDGWKAIPAGDTQHFEITPNTNSYFGNRRNAKLSDLFKKNVVLAYLSDRYELPDWLNETSLTEGVRFPEPVFFQGQTNRRIFSRTLLKPIIEWIKSLIFDIQLGDRESMRFCVGHGFETREVQGWIERPSENNRLFMRVRSILESVLRADANSILFSFSPRNTGNVGVSFRRNGQTHSLPNLLGLSAGEASLFSTFANILRDFDQANPTIRSIDELRGIVLLDEADLHLHVDLQLRVLPELLRLFPKIQFIITAHSPLYVMGMSEQFAPDAFHLYTLPTCDKIDTEDFAEFKNAMDAFITTRTFNQIVLDRVLQSSLPVLLVEGITDAKILLAAWQKINPGRPVPWDIVPCGGLDAAANRGGAKMLKTMLEACSLHTDRCVVGLFDYDMEGFEQFEGLKGCGFITDSKNTHLKHKKKPVHAFLLTVPAGRESFVQYGKSRSCYLSIEHLFADVLLHENHLADEPVVSDSAVFTIKSNSTIKKKFADNCGNYDIEKFANFVVLFDQLLVLSVASTENNIEYQSSHSTATVSVPVVPPGLLSLSTTTIHNTPTTTMNDKPLFAIPSVAESAEMHD
jgi:hypothetical protein